MGLWVGAQRRATPLGTGPALSFPEHCWVGTAPGVLQLQACPRHLEALLKTSATCCNFCQCKLATAQGTPLGWVAPRGLRALVLLHAAALFCLLRAASWGHGLCQGRFGLVHPLSTPLAACPAPPAQAPWPPLPIHHLPSLPCRVYKNTEELRTRIASGIIAPLRAPTEKPRKEQEAEKKDPGLVPDSDPLRVPPRQPRAPSR